MFEHMKNYEKLFEKVSKWLKPDTGLLFIHVFCHKNFPYEFKVKSSNNADWMARNFFTGGTMPAFDTFLFFQKNLAIQNTWMVNGVHYSKVSQIYLPRLRVTMLQTRSIQWYSFTRKINRKRGSESREKYFLNCFKII